MPLYQAQQEAATNAVIKTNAFSVQRLVDNYVALVDPVTTAELANQLKVKGKVLSAGCYKIESSGTPADHIVQSDTSWAVGITYHTNNCSELGDATLDSCVDSTGKITKGSGITTEACSDTTDLND